MLSCTVIQIATYNPFQEPHKRRLHGVKLKPLLIGVCSTGILKVDSITNELLSFWSYDVLKNWAYSLSTIAFVSMLVFIFNFLKFFYVSLFLNQYKLNR